MNNRNNKLAFYGVWTIVAAITAYVFSRDDLTVSPDKPIATLTAKTGDVVYRPEDLLLWRTPKLKQGLANGDRIATGANAQVSLQLQDGRTLELGPNSLVEVSADARPGREGTGEESLTLTVAKGTIQIGSAPASPPNGGKVGKAVKTSAAKTPPAVNIRVGRQALTLKKGSDEVRISKPAEGPVRIEAPAEVLATRHESAPVRPGLASLRKDATTDSSLNHAKTQEPAPILVATSPAAPQRSASPETVAKPKLPPSSAVGYKPVLVLPNLPNAASLPRVDYWITDRFTAPSRAKAPADANVYHPLRDLIGHGVHIILSGRKPARDASGLVQQSPRLSFQEGAGMTELYLLDGGDLLPLTAELQEAANVKIEAVNFTKVEPAGGIWLVRGESVRAWMRGSRLDQKLALNAFMRRARFDLAYAGNKRSLVSHTELAALSAPELWVVNRVYGQSFYPITRAFMNQSSYVKDYVLTTKYVLFTAPVRILVNRFRAEEVNAAH